MNSEQKIYSLMTGLENILDLAIAGKYKTCGHSSDFAIDAIVRRIHAAFGEVGICRNCRGTGDQRGIGSGNVEGYNGCMICNGTGEAA